MKKAYMAIDIGSINIKGILIDEEEKIILKCSFKIKEDYIKTYGRVINKLRGGINIEEYKICLVKITGNRKRLIERSLGKDCFTNIITSLYNYAIGRIPSVKTIIDIGNSLKIIKIKNNIINDYIIDDVNYYGIFIDKVLDILEIDYNSDINIYKSNINLLNKNTILFNYNIINHLLTKYSKEEILNSIYDLVIQNILYNVKKEELKSPILLTGGLSLNKGFVKKLEISLNKKIYVLDDSLYASVIGSIKINNLIINK